MRQVQHLFYLLSGFFRLERRTMYKQLLDNDYPTIRLPKDEQWTGIVLKGEDLLLLSQIYIHGSMRAPSIHDLYQMTYGRERNSNWISNRLKKFVQSGLLDRLQESLSEKGQLAGLTYYHYRLNKRGYEVLTSHGFIEQEEARKVMTLSKRRRLPSLHTRATSYLANITFLELLSNTRSVEGFSHIRGSRHPHLGVSEETVSDEIKGLIVPDWVFEKDNRIIAIEVDTGSQRGEKINQKYIRYLKMAEYLDSLGKELIVIFAVTDSSILDFAVGKDLRKENRDKRINSLKELFPPYTEWKENLLFYVATAKRVPSIVKHLLNNGPILSIDRIFSTGSWYDKMQKHIAKDYSLQIEQLNEVLLPNRDKRLDGELLFQMKKKGVLVSRHLILFSEEGSVSSYQRMRNNAYLTNEYNLVPSNRDNPLYLNVIYSEELSADEDVYGHELYENIYLRDISSLEICKGDHEKKVYSKRFASPYKKEEVKLFI